MHDNYNYTLDTRGKGYVCDDPKKPSQKVINIVRVLTKKALEEMQLGYSVEFSEVLAQGILNQIRENEEIKLF